MSRISTLDGAGGAGLSKAERAPRSGLAAYGELLKPITWFAPMWAFGCGIISSGKPVAGHVWLVLAGVALCGPLVTGTSQAVNDWYDRHVDAINEPGRAIPSGRVPGHGGLTLAGTWTFLSLAVAAALGQWAFGATVLGIGLGWAYSAPPLRLKLNGWLGNAACGACYEGLPWFTAAAIMAAGLPSHRIVWVALLYSIGAHGIMTLNDFKAIEGDRQMGVRSLPVMLGAETAARLACVVMAVPQMAVVSLLLRWGCVGQALAVAMLLVAQVALMTRLLRDPRGKAPWLQRHGHQPLRDWNAGDSFRAARTRGLKYERDRSMSERIFDAVVVGGGPAGATAASDLAKSGHSVLLLDRGGRIKPCGGAIPPVLIRDFEIPDSQLKARIRAARMVSPTNRQVDMPIDGGFVGMVDREHFDEWLRERAVHLGAERRTGFFDAVEHDEDGVAVVVYHSRQPDGSTVSGRARARVVVGADGAKSAVAKQCIAGAEKTPCVFAYHEIVRAPEHTQDALGRIFEAGRCDIFYQGKLSPDFYGWVFPHGDTVSVGSGSAQKGFSIRGSVTDLRAAAGLSGAETIRREGAPIPMKPLKRWDNGRDVVLAGDAAGVVAPASGEGIYYAMEGGRLAAQAVAKFCATGNVRALREPRRRFMKAHGRVFLILGIMQWFWYGSDKRREKFVSICRDADVQKLTWDAYMNKKLVRAKPAAHAKIFFKDLAHLFGFVTP